MADREPIYIKTPEGVNADVPADFLKRPNIKKYRIRFFFGEAFIGFTAAVEKGFPEKELIEASWGKSKHMAINQFGQRASTYTRYEIKELD